MFFVSLYVIDIYCGMMFCYSKFTNGYSKIGNKNFYTVNERK